MISRRHVFYLAGFDPIDAPAQHRRFTREIQKFARTWHATATVSELSIASHAVGTSWQAGAAGPNWQTQTTFELLDWQDIVRAEFPRPLALQAIEGMVTFADFIWSGAARQYVTLAWRYGAFFAAPFLSVIANTIIGLAVGIVVARLVTDNSILATAIVVLLACAVFALLIRWPGNRWHIRQGLVDWIFARDFMYGRRPEMDKRLDQFAARLVEASRTLECDEFVIVGHSLGSTMAVMAIERALKIDPDFARRRKVCLLTVGSTIPKLAFHPAATYLRACTARVAAEEGISWTEYQARRDAISFFRINPVTLQLSRSHGPNGKPCIREIGIKELMLPDVYARNFFKHMRLHYQFVMGNERRAQYDFYMFVCGPAAFDELSEGSNGPLDLFDPEGLYRSKPRQAFASALQEKSA